MRVRLIEVAALSLLVANCGKTRLDGTSLGNTRRPPASFSDAGGYRDVGSANAFRATPLQSGVDAAASPTAFRIVNHAGRTVYLDSKWDTVKCRTGSGETCAFFLHFCPNRCPKDGVKKNCCVQCEPPVPSMLVIRSEEGRVVPWSGTLRVREAKRCVECECDEEIPIPRGDYMAYVEAYAEYTCELPPCGTQPDGTIQNAVPRGRLMRAEARFSIPSDGSAVTIDIPRP